MNKSDLKKIELDIKTYTDSMREHIKFLIGKKVLILSNYNGQDYGRSKPSQKGKIHKISQADIVDGKIYIALRGFEYGHPFLELWEWELV